MRSSAPLKMRKQSKTRHWILLTYLLSFMCLFYLYFTYIHKKPSSYRFNFSSSSKASIAVDLVLVPISEIMTGEPITLLQNDTRILKYIWDNKLIEPETEANYNLSKPKKDPSMGQGQFIRRILGNMKNGFFVEAGALDGETRSNTLNLEQHLGWKGLLVEGDPSNYALMKKKNRKAWISKTCLAVKPYPHHANYLQKFNLGKIVDPGSSNKSTKIRGKVIKVQCMPLFSLLSALNVSTVDYFSLDVEGNELQVLKTIPFDQVFIKTLSVEFVHTPEGKQGILDYMKSKGYKKVGEVRAAGNLANDIMFVHSSVKVEVY